MSLPSGYKRLEYIESTGTQYISTGITPTENTKVVIEFNSSNSSGVVFGQDSGYKVNAFMFAMTVVVFDSTKKISQSAQTQSIPYRSHPKRSKSTMDLRNTFMQIR